jgi:hypothetical protein
MIIKSLHAKNGGTYGHRVAYTKIQNGKELNPITIQTAVHITMSQSINPNNSAKTQHTNSQVNNKITLLTEQSIDYKINIKESKQKKGQHYTCNQGRMSF